MHPIHPSCRHPWTVDIPKFRQSSDIFKGNLMIWITLDVMEKHNCFFYYQFLSNSRLQERFQQSLLISIEKYRKFSQMAHKWQST